MKFKRLKFKKLSTQIILIVTPVAFLNLVLFSIFIYAALKHSLLDYVKEDLSEEISRVHNELCLEDKQEFNVVIINFISLSKTIPTSLILLPLSGLPSQEE